MEKFLNWYAKYTPQTKCKRYRRRVVPFLDGDNGLTRNIRERGELLLRISGIGAMRVHRIAHGFGHESTIGSLSPHVKATIHDYSLCTLVNRIHATYIRYSMRSMSLLTNHGHDERPWGSFEQFTANEPSTVKLLRISPGQRFSLQKHAHRSEYWRVVTGSGIARVGEEDRDIIVGDTIEIPVGTLHRLTGGSDGLIVLEIAFGEFDEHDIERVEDDFGRT